MKVAIAQICSSADVDANLALVQQKIIEAAAAAATLVVFPEASMRSFGNPLKGVAEPLDGPFATAIRDTAQQHKITAVVGMYSPGDSSRVRNTLLVAGPNVEARYDKMHMYDAFGFTESDNVIPGDSPVTFTVDGVSVGLTTCYDIRFPALFTTYANQGASVVVVSASWADGPGKLEHWRLLAQARALDSTSFVLACDQAVPSASGVEAKEGAPTGVGHSMAVAPDGSIIAEAGVAPELLVIDLDLNLIEKTRKAIPVLKNARL